MIINRLSSVQFIKILLLIILFHFQNGLSLSVGSSRQQQQQPVGRRGFLFGTAVASPFLLSCPTTALAAKEQTISGGALSTKQVADLLYIVPTFAIVDPKGVPFMVVGEDAKITSYFFTTYGEAERLLNVARTSTDKAIVQAKKEQRPAEELINPWANARISTVPLDFAVSLVFKTRGVTKGGSGNYFLMAPADADVQDALDLDTTGRQEFPEGRVPLFYFADFKIENSGEKKRITPVYFRKSELLAAWKEKNPNKPVPPVLVTELFSLLASMVDPEGKYNASLKNLMFVAPQESPQKAQECKKAGGNEEPFVIGRRIVVL